MKKIISKYKKKFALFMLITGMFIGAVMPLSQCYSQSRITKIQNKTNGTDASENSDWKKKCGNIHIDTVALQNALNYESSHPNNLSPVNHLIKVYFHIFRDTDGSNPAASETEIESEFDRLKSDFSSGGICFIKMGLDYVDNSIFNNFFNVNMPLAENLLIPYTIEDCMDIFYHSELLGAGGSSYYIPYTICSIDARKIGSQAISHEIGHCLGLLHTFETAEGWECINGSNSAAAGDLITDTPADPWDLLGFDKLNCLFNGFCVDGCAQTNFSPPYNNIMSYWQYSTCYPNQEFTSGQFTRMNSFLDNSATLISCQSPSNFTLGPHNYSSGYYMYSAINTFTTNGNINLTGTTITTLGGGLVLLQPGFVANPSIGGLILIRVASCGSSSARNALETHPEIISNENQSGLKCYPNPFSSTIILKYKPTCTGKLKIEVMDIQGKIIKSMSQEISEKGVAIEIPLNLESISSGLYFLKVSDGMNSISKKIIKSE